MSEQRCCIMGFCAQMFRPLSLYLSGSELVGLGTSVRGKLFCSHLKNDHKENLVAVIAKRFVKFQFLKGLLL